jgi:subtilisin family serine protease
VLGIAAGSEVQGKKNIHQGVASQADIVAVELEGVSSEEGVEMFLDIMETVKYMFDYADSVGKPLVVNLSLGTNGYAFHGGDGESIIDLAFNEFIDENKNGKIVVVAAGNEGEEDIHFEANFDTEATSTVGTDVSFFTPPSVSA